MSDDQLTPELGPGDGLYGAVSRGRREMRALDVQGPESASERLPAPSNTSEPPEAGLSASQTGQDGADTAHDAGTGTRRADGQQGVRWFRLHLADGRVWHGAQFPDGFVCVHHPAEINICTIAVSLDGLLTGPHPDDPMHGARVEWPTADAATPHASPETTGDH